MSKAPFTWRSFDRQDYESVYRLQKTLVEERLQEAIPDTLLLGEHPHVITLGRGSHQENLLYVQDIPLVEIERGGDVTYHGPGQLVGYPILKLQPHEQDLHRYLRNLEEMLIQVLALYDLTGERRSGWTGVWVGERKIASIGVAVKKWVTYHGFALNISTDLRYFGTIHPCGLDSSVMTSLETLLGSEAISMATIQKQVLQAFETVFDRELTEFPSTAEPTPDRSLG